MARSKFSGAAPTEGQYRSFGWALANSSEIQPRSATVKVIEPALLYSMTNRDLYTLYGQDLNAYILVLQNICRQLARRLRKSDSRLSDLLAIMRKPTGGETV